MFIPRRLRTGLGLLTTAGWVVTVAFAADRPNFLLLTADDLNYDTPGFAGNPTAGITPNLDRLAREGMWFVHAHVTVAVCQPSRECLMTGRYPHRNGATGFYPVRKDVPTLIECLRAAGYHVGIIGKVAHLQPPEKFPWDFEADEEPTRAGRDPAAYGRLTREFLGQAKTAKRPFFLMANSHDPHRPFAGSEAASPRTTGQRDPHERAPGAEETAAVDYPPPRRTFRPAEVVVPGFVPDLPPVRTELAQYYGSVHRGDETVGEVLRALREAGCEETTLVMFLSDNGASLPFGKSNCYLTSTRTPWLVRWPGRIRPGAVDSTHMISGIDFMPTVLEAAGLPLPPGMDGRSFLPLLRGKRQAGCDRVFTAYDETSARRAYPMRALQTTRFGYIFNAWADGVTRYQAEPLSGLTFAAMRAAAATNPAVAERVTLLQYRVTEELYDWASDPHALTNLVGRRQFAGQLHRMRREMLSWMEQTGDPMVGSFRLRCAPANER